MLLIVLMIGAIHNFEQNKDTRNGGDCTSFEPWADISELWSQFIPSYLHRVWNWKVSDRALPRWTLMIETFWAPSSSELAIFWTIKVC
jgi:hypothetical protein